MRRINRSSELFLSCLYGCIISDGICHCEYCVVGGYLIRDVLYITVAESFMVFVPLTKYTAKSTLFLLQMKYRQTSIYRLIRENRKFLRYIEVGGISLGDISRFDRISHGFL